MSDTADRLAIIEACTRMAWYADQRELNRLGEVFADSVTLDFTSSHGGVPVTLTPAQIVEVWAGLLGAFDATHHLVTNHLVTLEGDSAVCAAAFHATHRLSDPSGGPLWTQGGTYQFDLVRVEGVWKIAGVVMAATWADGNRNLMSLAAGTR
ncbi:nuclear transport factor 2 family protein [Actinomadura spongiicola]|nr:nuclear transport factor 2 family protein [Actinomadura spongiicola]